MGFMENLTKKRISSIIKSKTGRNLDIYECVPVIILNNGMPNLTKHAGDGWFTVTNEGSFFVDNYVVIDFEPVRSISQQGNIVVLTLGDGTQVGIQPKHETARQVLLKTKIA